ncbi:MAG: 4Fe-4S binding protein [Candidatus Margulisbacteria bacterium]|jgi:dissimilatory sulfite reductase (desulfoviridin) alpha/beta subunit|nr:4Fe-4S binding protein [Candidatus Margulisiibacteriota bacterium]
MPELDTAELKKVGTIQQRDKEYFVLRLRLAGGNTNSADLRTVAEIASKYGRDAVHLSTRQGIEIPYVPADKVLEARQALEDAGLKMGACGPRIRVVVACQGKDICKWGIIDTKSIARRLDAEYFGQDTPHKFKFGVTGCPHNCAKASENDVGIMGGIRPEWQPENCTRCGLCVSVCPTQAIVQDGAKFTLNEEKCLYCSICTALCPQNSWRRKAEGYLLTIGGTMGKQQRLGDKLTGLLTDLETVYILIKKIVEYYRQNGRKRERFGQTIDRLGLARVREELLDGFSN